MLSKNEILLAFENTGLFYQDRDLMDKHKILIYLTDKGDTYPSKCIITLQNVTPNLIWKIRELRALGYSVRRIVRELRVYHTKVYRELKKMEKCNNCNVTIQSKGR